MKRAWAAAAAVALSRASRSARCKPRAQRALNPMIRARHSVDITTARAAWWNEGGASSETDAQEPRP